MFLDILFDVVGCFIFALGVQSLSAPYDLPPGGATGVAMLINHVTGLPVSGLVLAINIPLLILALLKLGRKFAFKSIKTVVILSFMLELCARIIPAYDGDIMLAALFGGVIQGAGLGMIMLRGSTTGGTDILSKLIQQKKPHVAIGRLILIIDAVILAATAIVYQSIGNAMYSLIISFVSTQVIDGILYGMDKGKMLMIVSDNYMEIFEMISQELGRGSTILHGTGAYTGEERPVLLCALSNSEFYPVKRIVHMLDPNAFVVALETNEVLGDGFKPLDVGR